MSKAVKCDVKYKRQPVCNHNACWNNYFIVNLNKSMASRMVFKKIGAETFALLNGDKYTKHFTRFVEATDASYERTT